MVDISKVTAVLAIVAIITSAGSIYYTFSLMGSMSNDLAGVRSSVDGLSSSTKDSLSSMQKSVGALNQGLEAVAGVVGIPWSPSSPTEGLERARLIAEARKEGALVIYSPE